MTEPKFAFEWEELVEEQCWVRHCSDGLLIESAQLKDGKWIVVGTRNLDIYDPQVKASFEEVKELVEASLKKQGYISMPSRFKTFI